jgi:hypothetical protein
MSTRRVLALEVSQMWCCIRYVSRVMVPSHAKMPIWYDRRVGVKFRWSTGGSKR